MVKTENKNTSFNRRLAEFQKQVIDDYSKNNRSHLNFQFAHVTIWSALFGHVERWHIRGFRVSVTMYQVKVYMYYGSDFQKCGTLLKHLHLCSKYSQ